MLEPDHELPLKFDGASVQWCPTQDVITVFSKSEKDQSHQLEVFRIGWEVEKIAQEMLPEEPSAVAFAQSGEHLAVGFKNGQLSILKTD